MAARSPSEGNRPQKPRGSSRPKGASTARAGDAAPSGTDDVGEVPDVVAAEPEPLPEATPLEPDEDGTVPLEGGASAPIAAGDGAEEALVAAVLSDPSGFDDVADLVRAEDFSVPVYRDIWEAIVSADAQGRPIDPVTIADELERAKRLARSGGLDGIREICERAADHPDHVEVYARLVADRALRRRVVNIGRGIVSYATREASDGADALAAAESAVLGVAMESRAEGPTPVAQAVPELLAELAKAREKLLLGHSTGLRDLDRLTGGVQGGQLIVIAARPGMGKSGLALQLARNIAEASGDMVAFVSYEMDTNELLVRALAAALGVPLGDLRRGTIPQEAEADLSRHAQRLASLPIVIDDRPPVTITGLRSSMRRLARRGPLAAIIVDYLQLMGGDRFVSSQNRTAEVSEISRGLKLLARELDVPVIALSQLNRQVEQRPNKRPMLADLRESGSIEQDADTVWMVYRDHVYNPESDPHAAELIVVKQRQGAQGTVHLEFDGAMGARFRDRPEGWAPQPAGPEPLRRGGIGGEPW